MCEDVTHGDCFRVQCRFELISAWVRVHFVFSHLYVQQSDPNVTAPASCQPYLHRCESIGSGLSIFVVSCCCARKTKTTPMVLQLLVLGVWGVCATKDMVCHIPSCDLCAPARYGKNPQVQCKVELIFCMVKGAFCHFPPLRTAIESYSLLLPRGSHSCTDMGYSGFSLSLFVISCCSGRKKKTARMLL